MARDIVETARKLRALTASPNEHEAALARETLQAYIVRHRIREAVLDEPPMLDEFVRQTLETNSAALQARMTAAYAEAMRLTRDAERFKIEYLRRLPTRYREKQLRQMPLEQQVRYRQAFEELRQASRDRKRDTRAGRMR